MLKSKASLLFGVLAMGIAASCTSEAPEIPASELYTREWVKQFGVMDATQDWNNATRGSVQVDVQGGPKRVKVTTVIDDVTYLLADYEGVSGSQKLEFDIPRGLTDIKVMTESRAVRTKVGGVATFTERANVADASGADENYIVNADGIKVSQVGYLISDGDEPTHYRDKLPEAELNVGKVPTNFEFTSNGSFIVYPIYWNTRSTNTVGIYTVDEATGEKSHYPFYTIKSGDELQFQTAITKLPTPYKSWSYNYGIFESWGLPETTDEFTDEDKKIFIQKFAEYAMEEKDTTLGTMGWNYQTPLYEIEVADWHDPDGAIVIYAYVGGVWNNAMNQDSFETWQTLPLNAWRSKGFKVDIEEGIKFGMYLKHSDGTLFYSQVEYNEPWEKNDEDGNPLNVPHASTYIHHCNNSHGYQEFRVLAFEDWAGKGSDVDLNDVVLYITSDNVEEIPDVEDHDASPIKWLVAAEDLGSVDDFDFNDVVFEVEHVAGRLVATIRPLAAGGTLETYLCRDGQRINRYEWHQLFGHDHTTIVNTGRASGKASTFTIDVPADFTLTSSTTGSAGMHENYRKNMGGFHLEVVREDGKVSTIEAPGVGEAPQMILVFQKDNKKWCWPTERTNIKHAYPQFETWMNANTGFSIDTDGENWFDFPSSIAGSVFNR